MKKKDDKIFTKSDLWFSAVYFNVIFTTKIIEIMKSN